MLWKRKTVSGSQINYCTRHFQTTSPDESFGESYKSKVPEPSVLWEGLGTPSAHPGISAPDGSVCPYAASAEPGPENASPCCIFTQALCSWVALCVHFPI